MRQLLNSELCTTETDLKEFVSMTYCMKYVFSALASMLCAHPLPMYNEYVATGSCSSLVPRPLFPQLRMDYITATQNKGLQLLHLLTFVGRHEAAEWLLRNDAYVHTRTHVSTRTS